MNLPSPSVSDLPRRLLFIDVARSLAIVLALTAHAMSAVQGYSLLEPSTKLWTKMLTRTATPLFVFMFGMMLELVYHRRWHEQGPVATSRRLWFRSVQCYAGYLATVLAGFLVGTRGATETLKAAVFLATPSFGFTLRFYFFALILAIPVLAMRARLGRGAMVAVLALIWASYPVLARIQVASSEFLPVPFGMLLGTVTNPVGPSVLQGFTFVLAGMLSASALASWRAQGLARFRRQISSMMLIAMVPLVYLCFQTSLPQIVEAFTGIVWRRQNHIGYYCVGLISSGLLLIGLSVLFPADREAPARADLSLAFGRSSLLAFTSGNVILIMASPWLTPWSAGSLLAVILLFLAAVWAIVVSSDLLRKRRSLPVEG